MTTPSQFDFSQLASHGAGKAYSEAFTETGVPRDHWESLLAEIQQLPPAELEQRVGQAQQILRENGLTYNVFGGQEGSRPWTLDLFPTTLSRPQWNWLQQAVSQRGRLLERIIQDIYGPQELMREGILPPQAIFQQANYQSTFVDLHSPLRRSLLLYATELARGRDGLWYAMADRTDAPVGLGFALENRIVTARLMPQMFHQLGIERLAPFFVRLKEFLEQSGETGTQPRIVLFSKGPYGRFYFEDVYLARYLGFTLAEGGDLAVRDDQVFLKTLSGLCPIDVLLSRTVEGELDPLEQGNAAAAGVPGLLHAIRRGKLRMANTPGCGLLESPFVMAFLPQMCQHLLGEPLMLQSIPTLWCGDPDSLKTVRERFKELVIKPAYQQSGSREYIVSRLSATERAALLDQVQQNPDAYVAQELIQRSSVPCWRDQQLQPGHVALRTFAFAKADGGYDLMPGGLVRIAPTADPMELTILAGISSKDLWIPSIAAVEDLSLLKPEGHPVQLKRSEPLFPSRVADNLFWLGQSLERADFLARLLRAICERLTSEGDENSPELSGLLQTLLTTSTSLAPDGSEPASFSPELISTQLVSFVFATRNSLSLGNAVAELQRLNLTVRDWISPDLWRTTRRAAEQFFAAQKQTDDLAEVLQVLDDLMLSIAAISGQLHDGMIRGPAWRFMDIGRRIDRAHNTAHLLATSIRMDLFRQRNMLKAIMEVLDCVMTYRTRYLDNIQTNGVFDLAITDETNPHSIGFQAILLTEHLDALPQDAHPLRSPEKRTLMSIVHAVRMTLDKQLEGSVPVQLLKSLERILIGLKELSDRLTRKYLVHATTTKQMHD
ncbi:MAG: circularly permuted type 2 ATP-grasp protein [Planctomycetaceae bacterium]|nr:circularly permuted type 2 ATP-grasp protein [Planctomycetaceae bacterium]